MAVNVKWVVVRFSVWFVCVMICSLKSLKMCIRSFLALSARRSEYVFRAARPSSLYKPMFLPNCFSSELRMNSLTSSHLSHICIHIY